MSGDSDSNHVSRLRRCFQPRQWFKGEGEPDPFIVQEEDTFMWVYRTHDGKYQVGYFMPNGEWFCDSEYDPEILGTKEAASAQASARVNYLNGGNRK